MEEVWPTAHIAELCLHSLPVQGHSNDLTVAVKEHVDNRVRLLCYSNVSVAVTE